jgi:hypothetical protein
VDNDGRRNNSITSCGRCGSMSSSRSASSCPHGVGLLLLAFTCVCAQKVNLRSEYFFIVQIPHCVDYSPTSALHSYFSHPLRCV